MAKKKGPVGGIQLPLFEPESSWQLPTEFPDLKDAKFIGIDVESKDPNLQKRGPGFIRGDAEVVGISLATDYGFKIYLPFGHATGENLDKTQVLNYVKAQISNSDQIKVGANLMYEQEALWSLGLEMKGPLYDIQVAGPLLDEERPGGFSLEALSQGYLGVGKSEQMLGEAADAWGVDRKSGLWMMPPKFSGEYAEDDAYYPIQIIQKQLKELDNEKLMPIFELETKLLRILWKMRLKGIKVDLERAEQFSKEVKVEEEKLITEMREMVGLNINPQSSKSLEAAFHHLGLSQHIRYTAPSKNYPGGQASFTSEFFKDMKDIHPFCTMVNEWRVTTKMRSDFIDGVVLGYNVNGRLHPQWHQLRQDDEDRANGTRSGRIASSKPNLTQVPSRHPRWGKAIRSLFKPDEGGKYTKLDYSQQEPRGMLHFAYLKGYPGAAEARQRYIDDPSTDYHQLVADLVHEKSGLDIGRRPAKDINLGSAYGMGKPKMARKLGIDMETATQIFEAYHTGVPYVKKLEQHCMELVEKNGFIRTFLGRKRRFNEWEPWDFKKKYGAIPTRNYDEAVEMWGKVARAGAHKALNAMVQGTAADQTKQAIVILDEKGWLPQLQVYDELGGTTYDMDEVRMIKQVMEHAIELNVPSLVEPELGLSWGEVEEVEV